MFLGAAKPALRVILVIEVNTTMKLIYNEHSLKPGIYKILNTHTGRQYIGQAKRFKERWRSHASSLLKGKHQNKFLQADFNKCKEVLGHDDFLEFHVLEVLEGSTKEERNKREEESIGSIYHDLLPDGSRVCYNFKEKTEALERSCYSNTPEETKAKKSDSMKKVWENEVYRSTLAEKAKRFWNTEEGKATASKRAQTIWNDPEHQEAMSLWMKNRMSDPEVKEAAIKSLNTEESVRKRAETYRGRLASEPEFKAKMQAHGRKNIAKRNSSQPVKTYGSVQAPDGTVYRNISHIPTFAKTHGLQKQNLYSLLSGKIKSHKGWILFKENVLLKPLLIVEDNQEEERRGDIGEIRCRVCS